MKRLTRSHRAMTATPLHLLAPSNYCSHLLGKSRQPEKYSDTTLANRASSPATVSLDTRRVTNQQSRTSGYFGFITWTVAERRIGNENDVKSTVYRKESITIRLPFTSTQLRIHYFGGMGTPSYTLNVTHVIEDESKLGHKLCLLMRPGGDVKELHELISGRKLSIYSVYRRGSNEMNLFFVRITGGLRDLCFVDAKYIQFAVGMRWAEGCNYLLKHDFRNQFQQEYAVPPIFKISRH